MSSLYGLTFQLEEPTPNKPTKVINIMVDEEGEKYIDYLHKQLQQKENIIKEVREKIHDIWFKIDFTNMTSVGYVTIKLDETSQGNELLEILGEKNNDK